MEAPKAPAEPSWPGVLRTKEFKEKIKSAKVLCVGAGGIGCELLKTLVCTGFRNIEVIDLDTIETSNLNRQFLFRKHHVGQSKANTAAAVVQGFCPGASITPYHANVKEGRFDVDFFRRFDLVLNGLDNLEARRHVNRLCLAAERPLVESGTAGYLGQVTVHIKGRTECFECSAKPAPKTYPICTLRNTPDKPIHTIVWAKDLLFNRLFGAPDAVSDLDDQAAREGGQPGKQEEGDKEGGEGKEGAAEAGEQSEEARAAAASAAAAAAQAEDPSFFLRRDGEPALEYAARVFGRVYTTDIQRLAEVKELWEKRPPPRALHLDQLLPPAERAALQAALDKAAEAGAGAGASACKLLGLSNASQKWTPGQNAAVLLLATALYHTVRPSEVGSAAFDKDDLLAVEFVTAASNLRSSCYGIPEQSLFDAKGMAGNIIHAIATTNAVVSGLIVTEALKILAGCLGSLRNTFLYEVPVDRRLVVPATAWEPRPSCMVCGKTQLTLRINTKTTPLSGLVGAVIKKRLAVNSPNLMCGGFLYEEGEGLEEDEEAAYAALLPRPLRDLPGGGLGHGAILTVQDQSQHWGVDVIIAHTEDLSPDDAPEGFILEGALPTASAPAPPEQDGGKQQQQEAPSAAAKRKAAAAVAEDAAGVLHITDSDDDDDEQEGKEEEGQQQQQQQQQGAGTSVAAGAAAATANDSRKRPLDEDGDGDGAAAGGGGGGGGGEERGAKRAKAETAPAPAEDKDGCIVIDDDEDD
ncbi:hypothetical protein CHLRE_06g296983v5 [Chlamydomonas reinhardtii]|uniref:SUMO-activating enzyme subunit n=1 Tax=Chlamydomonas reinhardtii TaxID=3055 RepID=A0A2K3DQP2_CHLRE|nr:uncharacterized protein CHLRE_06g296983v5 [Chlamydomonas reinhardtii]PNW82850.1 hypothetical protein CHLRE_06g296983v5 [Chlamydomonas reinhardtii]